MRCGSIGRLDRKPAVVGHSFGGLIAQKIAGEGAAVVTVAIDPAPGRGVLPLPPSALKAGSPVLGNPANARRSVTLTFDEFKYGWANGLDEEEAGSCTTSSTSRRPAYRSSRRLSPT